MEENEEKSTDIAERDETGRFLTSGNPKGRPKGSKNRVTLLKLMAEEAVREDNSDDMLKVARLVIDQAMEGDSRSQKLVWDAIVSKGTTDDRAVAKEKVEINIGGYVPNSAPVEVRSTTIDQLEDDTDEREQSEEP